MAKKNPYNEKSNNKGDVYRVFNEESPLGSKGVNNELIYVGKKNNKDTYLLDEDRNGDREFDVYTFTNKERDTFAKKTKDKFSDKEIKKEYEYLKFFNKI